MSDELVQQSEAREPDTDRRRWPLPRSVALVLAALLGLYLLVAQLFAVVPVGWTSPLLQIFPVQTAMLILGSLRDSMGSWNLVLGIISVALAVFAFRGGRPRRLTSTVAGITGAGLALTIVTSAALVYSMHQHTGRWVLFAPAVPLAAVGGQPDRTVTYATIDGQHMKADLYLPDNDGPVPLVVSIHGGGFIAGSRGATPYTRWLADQGYAVLDVDYRLSDATVHRWDTEDADVACAMTWATAHADEYGWDMGRVATFGGSAGGNLAINVANKINADALKPTCGDVADLPRVRAVVGIYPAVDLTASENDSAGGADVGRKYLGGSPAEYPERYAATDSAPQLSPRSPPTLLIQSGADHLVFASHTADFADDLAAAGIPHRYVEVPFVEHAYDAAVLTTGAQLGRELTLDWLRRYTG
ncbi:alpha/beta hydrolase [Nocardia cyriacigeorgica]|uniref:Alpha/beta hydrolase n=1 Tax=Nocardia cyriacigeorgica TaxID=135487 RepID=A0A6P1D9Q6_9NOCA|nr:alpha/beta hydrolase [Nocardia cyriacigeorgica]NEW39817.1 alpha/beta hydrolase [Nocardia cyriacigeorgica]NEW46281.1 alpha/beta hydrolase [Nocardia cyriacigeorgica]